MLVTDLELGAHELNEAHLVDKEDVSFLENFDISNGAPGERRKATLQWDVLEDCVDSIECR